MRIIFMGTPEFAVPTLHEIAGAGHEIVAVYTRKGAPKPAGRGQAERKSPVHEAAEALGIPVFTPKSCAASRSNWCSPATAPISASSSPMAC